MDTRGLSPGIVIPLHRPQKWRPRVTTNCGTREPALSTVEHGWRQSAAARTVWHH